MKLRLGSRSRMSSSLVTIPARTHWQVCRGFCRACSPRHRRDSGYFTSGHIAAGVEAWQIPQAASGCLIITFAPAPISVAPLVHPTSAYPSGMLHTAQSRVPCAYTYNACTGPSASYRCPLSPTCQCGSRTSLTPAKCALSELADAQLECMYASSWFSSSAFCSSCFL